MHFLKIHVFLGWVLRILWSEVMNNFGVPKICVAGELSCWGCNWNISAKFHSLLLLERYKIHMKKYTFWAILRCIIDALSNLVHAGEQVRKCTCNDSFSYGLRHKDSLPFPRKKIDSGAFFGITLVFLPIRR